VLPEVRQLFPAFFTHEWSRQSDGEFHLTWISSPLSRFGGDMFVPKNLSQLGTNLIQEKAIQELHLGFKSLTDHVCKTLRRRSSLTSLSIAPTDESADTVYDALYYDSSLRSLVLRDDLLSEVGQTMILRALACSNLSTLEFSVFQPIPEGLDESLRNLKHLTALRIHGIYSKLADWAPALHDLSSLTALSLEMKERSLSPLVKHLPNLPLLKYLNLKNDEALTDQSLFRLLEALPLRSIQELHLGRVLLPNDFQLVANALPSLTSLHLLSLTIRGQADNFRFDRQSALVSVFRALTRSGSSVKILRLKGLDFHCSVLATCLDLVPQTQLTDFSLDCYLYPDDVDTTRYRQTRNSFVTELKGGISWDTRFPRLTERFCCMNVHLSNAKQED
jgi:hypothetical protein